METGTQPPADFLCTDISLAAGEPQPGTAVTAGVWVMLEVREPWDAKAPAVHTLPADFAAWLDMQMNGVPNGRLQFIRQSQFTGPLACFVAILDQTAPRLYHFEVDEVESLMPLVDLVGLIAGESRYDPFLTHDPLLLVCTHGKRDRCCALLGVSLYNALSEQLGEQVWQTTHLGGHRFAGTLVSFPDGAAYGRLSPAEVPVFLAHLQQGQLYLEKLRGRTHLGPIEQVAEQALREQTEQREVLAWRHVRTRETAVGQWQLIFQHQQTGDQVELLVKQQAEPLRLYASSGIYKIKEIPQYSVDAIKPI